MPQKLLLLLVIFSVINLSQAQPLKQMNAAEIQLALNKLNVLGSVLYIAAHPDDENTAILAYLANERLLRTGYLSITRGEGGQNLIGAEQGELLGVLRTQELLAARRMDRAEQFFTRAIDFGYSKSAAETMRIWDKEKVLSDMVWIIRNFKPDVILTRFSKTQGGHGHHLASALLAEEAFHAAADPNRFAEHLKTVGIWQAKRILWNTWQPEAEKSAAGAPPIIQIDVGIFNPLLGATYLDLAAESRTMHKSQGFGSSSRRGSYINFFEHTAGERAQDDLFDDVDLSWSRISGANEIKRYINWASTTFDTQNPLKVIPVLLSAYRELDKLPQSHWIKIKKQEIKEIIRNCAGLWMEAIAADYAVSAGDSLSISTQIINRSKVTVLLENIELINFREKTNPNLVLESNRPHNYNFTLKIPEHAQWSQPDWLREKADPGAFHAKENPYIGSSENAAELYARFWLKIDDTSLDFELPILYRWTDAIKGEQYRPLIIQPPLSVELDRPVYVFPGHKSRIINVQVKANRDNMQGQLYLNLPPKWRSQPQAVLFSFGAKGETKKFLFNLFPSQGASTGMVEARVKMGTDEFNYSKTEIKYDHIPIQTVFKTAQARVLPLDIKKRGQRIGYIMGSGDEIPESLQQIGYQVDLLKDEDIEARDLSGYDALVCGVRAFNTRQQLPDLQSKILDYVQAGGTWLVQHNTRFGFKSEQIGPFPFKIGGERISEETARFTFINPDHQLLNFPNKINQNDFADWVQERGLYFAREWAPQYEIILGGNDTDEELKLGSILFCRYGKGVFIYTGLSFFRQLPAGVSGAYRLFVNLISAGKYRHEQ